MRGMREELSDLSVSSTIKHIQMTMHAVETRAGSIHINCNQLTVITSIVHQDYLDLHGHLRWRSGSTLTSCAPRSLPSPFQRRLLHLTLPTTPYCSASTAFLGLCYISCLLPPTNRLLDAMRYSTKRQTSSSSYCPRCRWRLSSSLSPAVKPAPPSTMEFVVSTLSRPLS